MNKILCIALIAIAILTGTSACKTSKLKKHKKQEVKNDSLKQTVQSPKIDTTKSETSTSSQIDSTHQVTATQYIGKVLKPNSLSTKAKVSYEGGNKSFDFNANIRIKKDSIIWVYINVAGLLPIARAIITPDSFKAVIYTEREAYIGSVNKLSSFITEGLDFYSLQNLLLGNPIQKNAQLTQSLIKDNNIIISLNAQNYNEYARYSLIDSNLLQDILMGKNDTTLSLNQILNQYQLIGNNKFSTSRTLKVSSGDNKFNATINFNNIQFDQILEFPFSIPSNYPIK